MDEDTFHRHVKETVWRLGAAEKDALLRALIMKRAVDGLNGREWDSGLHLKWEKTAARLLNETHTT